MDDFERLKKVCMEYESKMIKLMGKEYFVRFSESIAKKIFKEEVENMQDSDFKKFCLDNFDKITK